MEGRLLSESVAVTERARLQHAFSSCGVDGRETAGHNPTVVLLPTTFLRQTAPPVNVDLFIVHRQPSFTISACGPHSPGSSRCSAVAMTSAFLLGFRLCQTNEVTPVLHEGNNAATERSAHGQSNRRRCRRVRFDEQSLVSDISEMSSQSSHSQAGSFGKGSAIRKRGKTLFAESSHAIPPILGFHTSEDGDYLRHCAESVLEDLLSSLNFELYGCCRWHMSLRLLSKWIDDMHPWRSCTDLWPLQSPSWQCTTCRALIFSDQDAACWVCSSERQP